MNRYQPIYDIAELCAQHGLRNAVLCPGSRCAPLTIAFVRHSQIITRTFPDERSAGFIALGLAQQTNIPSILLCTSGSAAYNFAPAIAEAFFSETPMLVFTADRPAEWIAQHDGQTIHQPDIFGKHVKKSFSLPQDYEHPDSRWAINRIINEAINVSRQSPAGPVHINAPFREPLYPVPGEQISFSNDLRVISQLRHGDGITEEQKHYIKTNLPRFTKVLVVGGQGDPETEVLAHLNTIQDKLRFCVIGDVISNLHSLPSVIRHADSFLSHLPEKKKQALQPDLLITFGKSVISKNLKIFLRKYPAAEHWHFQSHDSIADPFQSITKIFQCNPASALELIASTGLPASAGQGGYAAAWATEENRTANVIDAFLSEAGYGELSMVHALMKHLPERCNLHLANSMSVRYANIVGLTAAQKSTRVFANRGTSGIDGCTSTTVGHGFASNALNILITGDIAFFYDRNAFWHNYPIPNLKILLLNNHGGVIFGMIDGPASLPEAQEYFVTQQRLSAKHLCEEFGLQRFTVGDHAGAAEVINQFLRTDKSPAILEIETETMVNRTIFDNLKKQIKNNYEFKV